MKKVADDLKKEIMAAFDESKSALESALGTMRESVQDSG